MLGLALIRLLLQMDFKIYAVVRPNSRRAANIPKNERVKIIECELGDMDKLPGLIEEKCEMFFHFAWRATSGIARNDMGAQIDNIRDTVKAAEICADLGCEVFVGAGSQAEYGRHSAPISPKTPAFPENGYGMAKLCAGQMTREVCRQKGVRHIWCRIFSVYGLYDGENTMIMSGINALLNGQRPIYTMGEQLWDYLYCDDAANALFLAAERGRDGSVYCVGSGEARPLRDYIFAIRDAVSPGSDIGIGEVPYSKKQVMYLCADISDLQNDTGFSPSVSFEEGIMRILKAACR